MNCPWTYLSDWVYHSIMITDRPKMQVKPTMSYERVLVGNGDFI